MGTRSLIMREGARGNWNEACSVVASIVHGL